MTEHCPPDDCHAGHELTPLQARALLALVIDCALPDAPLPGAPGADARQSSAARADAANTRGSGGIPRQALYFCTLAMVLLGFSRADSVSAPIDESPRNEFSIRASNGSPSRGSVLSHPPVVRQDSISDQEHQMAALCNPIVAVVSALAPIASIAAPA
ncbi:MAG: hypothetical protein FGM37_03270, partial [Phycisphaerales bacterium]|nr:hypothetical protein [Phycisphaerales bacterium]